MKHISVQITQPMMSNDKESVLILIADPGFHDSYVSLRKQLEKLDKSRRYILINSHGEDTSESIYFYQDFTPKGGRLVDVAQEIRNKYGIEARFLYGSDQGFIYRRFEERYFVEKALFSLSKIEKLIDDWNVRYIFSGGGGTLFTNAFFELAKEKPEICAYRFFPIHYLNNDSSNYRYFFCDNNYFRLSQLTTNERSDNRYARCQIKAQDYVSAVKSGLLRPDRDAREISRKGTFTATGASDLIRMSAKALRLIIIRNKTGSSIKHSREISKIRSYIRKRYLDFRRTTYPSKMCTIPYFLFVLHHPIDSQIAFRGRHFSDQIATARIIASNLPAGTHLLVKEHPVFPGMTSIRDLRLLESMYPNTVYVDYSQRFTDLVQDAVGVITVNSTAGLETMIHGVPVAVLGEAFYRDKPFVYSISYLWEMTDVMKDMLINPRIPSNQQVIDMIAELLYQSEPDPEIEGRESTNYLSAGICKRVGIAKEWK